MAMTTNPYEASHALPAPSHTRRSWLKSPLLWFPVGFLVAWTIWTIWNYVAYSPKDFSRGLPEEVREASEWLKNAKGRKVGQFTIIAASDPKTASAQVYPTKPNHKPSVEFGDTDSDGHADLLVVSDGKNRAFSFQIADGAFQSFSFSPDAFSIDEFSYDDYDMDGRFDFRLGPGRRMALMVNSEWRELIAEGGGKGYVEIDGKRHRAEYVNGNWRVEPTAEAKD
jgi:hypothetical protein